jgi:hypothetical protein
VLTLTLSDAAIRAILYHQIVRIADFEADPDYSESRYSVAVSISEARPGQPFPVSVYEAWALLEAISEAFPTLPPESRAAVQGVLDALDGN